MVAARRDRIELTSSGGPVGLGWTASVRLEITESGYRVVQRTEEYRKRHTLRTSDEPWRALANLLARGPAEWALPFACIPHVFASGVEGWRADLLALAWGRIDEGQQTTPARLLLAIPDDWLRAYGEAGRITRLRNNGEAVLDELQFLILVDGLEENPLELRNWLASLVTPQADPFSAALARLRSREAEYL